MGCSHYFCSMDAMNETVDGEKEKIIAILLFQLKSISERALGDIAVLRESIRAQSVLLRKLEFVGTVIEDINSKVVEEGHSQDIETLDKMFRCVIDAYSPST